MNFKVYQRQFEDGYRVVGNQAVENPDYDGKSYPCIIFYEGESHDCLISEDSEYWFDASSRDRSVHSFVVHELGGREKVVERLEKIAQKFKPLQVR